MQKIREAWKAVVALAIPILIGATGEIVDGLGAWFADQGFVWSGAVVGVLSAVGVWLKSNA